MAAPKNDVSGKKKEKHDAKYQEALIAHGLSLDELPEDLKGNPVRLPQVNFDVPLEQKVRAKMGPPPYAVRAKLVEDMTHELETELFKKWKQVAATYRADARQFERVWKIIVETLELEDLNALIKEHNRFYPIEANLHEDPDTGQIMIGNTVWKPKRKLAPERLLKKFPADLPTALAADKMIGE